MIIFSFLFISIILNIFLFNKNRKWFIIISFFELFIVAALRKYTVGIDLKGHYANNFITLGKMEWGKINYIIESKSSFYDFGLIIFMKAVSSICKSQQFFIIVTSAITYGLIGRYIYKHSDNVYLETFLFITTYSYFMYMNIIAQGLALAIILTSIDFLEKKSYVKFALLVLLANCIHSSAIICLLFIPLRNMKLKKSNLKLVAIVSIVMIILLDRILPIILEYIYPQFAFYFRNKSGNSIDKMQLIHMLLYLMFFGISLVINFYVSNEKKIITKVEKNANLKNFLFCASIISILFRYLGMSAYIFSRMGFYFYMFSYTLLVESLEEIKEPKNRMIFKLCIYSGMFVFFILLRNSLKVSYGVSPYNFFWQ